MANRLADNNYIAAELLGFFDDGPKTAYPSNDYPMLGRLNDISAYVKEHRVNIIYLALPSSSQDEMTLPRRQTSARSATS